MVQLMPLPLTVSGFSQIQTGFTFLVPAHPGSPGQRAVKWVCCIRVCLLIDACFSILSIFSSIIPPHCIAFFPSSLFVLKMQMSPLFIKGYLT